MDKKDVTHIIARLAEIPAADLAAWLNGLYEYAYSAEQYAVDHELKDERTVAAIKFLHARIGELAFGSGPIREELDRLAPYTWPIGRAGTLSDPADPGDPTYYAAADENPL